MTRLLMHSRFVTSLLAILILALLAAGNVAAQSFGSDKASNGRFTGLALLTDDPNWHKLFLRPETPHVSGRDQFGRGERGVLAILFSDAEPQDGMVKILCDVTAFDPNGSRKIVESGPCYEGPYRGPNTLHPTLLDLQFTIGPDDPEGRAGFKVTIEDAYARRKIDLEVSFAQRAGR